MVKLTHSQLRMLAISNMCAFAFQLALALSVAALGDWSTSHPLYMVYTSNGVSTLRRFGSFPITAFTFTFPLVTAIFHAGNACVWSGAYYTHIEQCRTPTRWIGMTCASYSYSMRVRIKM